MEPHCALKTRTHLLKNRSCFHHNANDRFGLNSKKGTVLHHETQSPLRARQYIKCLSKRRNDANVRIANRLFPCCGGMSLACHVVDACLSCCVFHVLQITKEKWMICFGEVLRGALRYLGAKILQMSVKTSNLFEMFLPSAAYLLQR